MTFTPIEHLPNLGLKSARWLKVVGVHSVEDLRASGALTVFKRLQLIGERPSLMLLWAMVAGLRGEHWTRVSPEEKRALKAALEQL